MPASKLGILFLAAAAGALLAAFVSLPPAHAVRGARHGLVARMARELRLDEQQVAAVRSVVDQHRPELRAAARQSAAARAALRHAAATQPPDESAVRSAADALGRAIGDRAVLRSRIAAEVRPLLTAEQAARLDQLRDQGDQRRAERAGAR